jgi:hypothetical protein
MKLPLFKRRSMSYSMWNYHSEHTDVWAYGTIDQYSAFSDLLRSNNGLIRGRADSRGGMDLLLLPPAQGVLRDFVVLHERLVHRDGRFNMELIVGGSKSGLKELAKYFSRARKRYEGLPDSHLHFDDREKLLLMPSVFLQICGPHLEMDQQIGVYAPPASSDLIPNVGYSDPENWAYEDITCYGDLHGRIPIKSKANKTRRSNLYQTPC